MRLRGSRQLVAYNDRTGLAAAALLLMAAILGGASMGNALPLMAIELIALPFLLAAVWRLARKPLIGWFEFALLALLLAIPLMQLVPLPPALWSGLAGRAVVVEAQALAGIVPVWKPISLTPNDTVRYLLALIPSVAVFLITLTLGAGQRWLVALALLAAVAASMMLGLGQLAAGAGSSLYLNPTSHNIHAIGFFTNRNHEAIALVTAIPFAGAWVAANRHGRGGWNPLAMLGVGLWLLFALGAWTTKSRAGIILFAPALAGAILIIAEDRIRKHARLAIVGSLALLALSGVVGALSWRQLGAFIAPDGPELRFAVAPEIAKLGMEHAPFGSGLGAFDTVYRAAERLERVNPFYLNRAHNDYLEIFVEAGWLGVVAVAGFVAWFSLRTYSVWREPAGREYTLAKAATIAIALLLLHSVVDYPLRTVALSCVFAFACALIATRRPTDQNSGG